MNIDARGAATSIFIIYMKYDIFPNQIKKINTFQIKSRENNLVLNLNYVFNVNQVQVQLTFTSGTHFPP